MLGPTFDYTHRLLETQPAPDDLIERSPQGCDDARVGDLAQDPLRFPADRDLRPQNLARGDEGFLLALGYLTQRGYGRNHSFAGKIRLGEVEVEFAPEEIGFAVPLGRITVTECQMVNQFHGTATEPPRLTRGLNVAADNVHADPAAGNIRDFLGGREAGQKDEIIDLLVGQTIHHLALMLRILVEEIHRTADDQFTTVVRYSPHCPIVSVATDVRVKVARRVFPWSCRGWRGHCGCGDCCECAESKLVARDTLYVPTYVICADMRGYTQRERHGFTPRLSVARDAHAIRGGCRTAQ